MIDMTVPFRRGSRRSGWNYIPTERHVHQARGREFFGMGRNGLDLQCQYPHWAAHMDGEKNFIPRAAPHRPGAALEEWVGPRRDWPTISQLVAIARFYTPKMRPRRGRHPQRVIFSSFKTGWNQFRLTSPRVGRVRFMVKHPGPSPDFGHVAADMQSSGSGVDAVSAIIP